MKDPLDAFEQIRDNFLLYIRTAFSTRFPGIEAERERLLRETKTFCQELWIEPLPTYTTNLAKMSGSKTATRPGCGHAMKNITRLVHASFETTADWIPSNYVERADERCI